MCSGSNFSTTPDVGIWGDIRQGKKQCGKERQRSNCSYLNGLQAENYGKLIQYFWEENELHAQCNSKIIITTCGSSVCTAWKWHVVLKHARINAVTDLATYLIKYRKRLQDKKLLLQLSWLMISDVGCCCDVYETVLQIEITDRLNSADTLLYNPLNRQSVTCRH